MRSDELRDAGALTSTALTEITELARDVHRACANRLFGLAGKPGKSIQLLHDGIAAIAYESTRLGVKVLPRAAGLAASANADPAAPSAHDEPRGRFVLGAINGFWGDRIAERQAALAPQMRLRVHGGPLRRIPANVVDDAAPAATGRLVIFLHGLCETDLCWSFSAEKCWGDRTCTYGSMLRDDDGWTPIYANFNTGVHISANGTELAGQLEQLAARWPVPITDIALVGHSLGGLVARSAAHQGDELGHEWRRKLKHIVGLGTPHLGAPLERFANWGTHRLARLPETQPFAKWLNQRSVGIKDLRYGALLEADWLDHDLDDLLTDHCTEATLLPGVVYSQVSATLSREPAGIFAHDLLVQHGSAHGIGQPRSIPFDPDCSFHIGGRKHHFDLLADRTVYDQLRFWLAGGDRIEASATDPEPSRWAKRREARRAARRSA